jgi:hypothetical protein
MGREGPHLDEITAPTVVLGRGYLVEPQVLRYVRSAQLVDVRRRNLEPILEKPVQEEAPAIALRVRTLEIN